MCEKYYNEIKNIINSSKNIINNHDIFSYIYNINKYIKNIKSSLEKNKKIKIDESYIIRTKANLKQIKKYLTNCLKFRKNHHLNCVKYIGSDKDKEDSIGDIGHSVYLKKIEYLIEKIEETYQELKTIKQLKSDRDVDNVKVVIPKYDSRTKLVKFSNKNYIFKKKSNIKIKYGSTKIRRFKSKSNRSIRKSIKKYNRKKTNRSRRNRKKSYKTSRK